jgi:hypothetical protein
MIQSVAVAGQRMPCAQMDLQQGLLAALEPNVRCGLFGPVEQLD